MQLKEVLGISENKKNKQAIWNPKKRKLNELGISEEEILNMKIDNKLLK
jgi:hypothetical protein